MSTLQHERVSAPFDLFTFDMQSFTLGQGPPEVEQTIDVEVEPTEEGRIDAILFWFNLHLAPDVIVSTWDEQYHFHQAAIRFNQDSEKFALGGQPLRFSVNFNNGRLAAAFLD